MNEQTIKIEMPNEEIIQAGFTGEHLVLTFEDRHRRKHQIIPIEYAKKLIQFLNENQQK